MIEDLKKNQASFEEKLDELAKFLQVNGLSVGITWDNKLQVQDEVNHMCYRPKASLLSPAEIWDFLHNRELNSDKS